MNNSFRRLKLIKKTSTDNYNFLAGGDKMGKMIRAFDWSKTAVGTIDHWPQSLRTAVNIMLNSSSGYFTFVLQPITHKNKKVERTR